MFSVDRRINKLIAGKTPSLGAPKFVSPKVRNGVYNFFNNLGEPVTAANDVLQMKWKRAGVATARFATNTTVGLLGTDDVASRWGLKRHREDFGQTLARWGAPAGPYIYLPLMGPSTVRDKLAGKVDGFAHPLGWVEMDELPSRVMDYTESAVQPKTVSIRTRARVAQEAGETEDEYAYLRRLYYAQRAAEIQDTPEADRYIVPSAGEPGPITVQAPVVADAASIARSDSEAEAEADAREADIVAEAAGARP
jgi:phospholipid-binding lipoprotein MlaA